MPVYVGRRNPNGTTLVEVHSHHGNEPLALRRDTASRGIDGFDWGDDSEGAEQLAFALLVDVLGDDAAWMSYREFVDQVIRDLPYDGWRRCKNWVREWFHRSVGSNYVANESDWEHEALVDSFPELRARRTDPDRSDDCWYLAG